MTELYIPTLEDLWFREKLLSDPATMSYHANREVSHEGYHRDTGCIDFPKTDWEAWHAHWIGHEPERFYAYIRRKTDGEFIGEVNFHYNPEKKYHDMGIVIYAPYRGMGYAVPTLRLMVNHAFGTCMIGCLHNEFEIERKEFSAWRTHFSAGFREVSQQNGVFSVMLTRENWLDAILQTEEDENDEENDPFHSFRMRF